MISRSEVFEETRLPRELVHREGDVDQLSRALQPALQGHRPEDVLISGSSGVGKTALARFLLDNPRSPIDVASAHIPALGMTTGQILRAAINAHPSDVTAHRGMATDELPEILREAVDDPYVLILDEADDLPETDVLDALAGVPGVGVIAIAHNPTDWLARIDQDYRAAFDGEHHIALDTFGVEELADILEPRVERGLEPGVVTRAELVAIGDLVNGRARNGIQTLKWAAKLASRDHVDRIDQCHIVDGRLEAQREIREASLASLPLHHQVLYELVRATCPVGSSELHERYEEIAERAYAGNPATPLTTDRSRTLKLRKLREYDLVEWTERKNNSRTYDVVDASITSELDIPVTVFY